MSPPAPRLLPSSGLASPLPPCSSPFLTTSIVLRTVGSITQPRARERWASLACPPPLPIPACPLPPAQKRPRQKVRMEAQHQQPPQQSSSDTRASGTQLHAGSGGWQGKAGRRRLAGDGRWPLAGACWREGQGQTYERSHKHTVSETEIRLCALAMVSPGWWMVHGMIIGGRFAFKVNYAGVVVFVSNWCISNQANAVARPATFCLLYCSYRAQSSELYGTSNARERPGAQGRRLGGCSHL